MEFTAEQVRIILESCFDNCETVEGRKALISAIELFEESGRKAEVVLHNVLAWKYLR